MPRDFGRSSKGGEDFEEDYREDTNVDQFCNDDDVSVIVTSGHAYAVA